MLKRFVIVSAVLVSPVLAFVGPTPARPRAHALIIGSSSNSLLAAVSTTKTTTDSSSSTDDDNKPEFDIEQQLSSGMPSRRDMIANTASSALLSILALSQNSPMASAAATATAIGTSPDSPIVVLGGGGKVGKLCTQILADKGLYVRCTTRSGRQILDGESKFVSYVPCDVTNDESLKQALSGASGCIFAASSSGKKKGGDPIGTFSLSL
jgi:NAD(P)H-binding